MGMESASYFTACSLSGSCLPFLILCWISLSSSLERLPRLVPCGHAVECGSLGCTPSWGCAVSSRDAGIGRPLISQLRTEDNGAPGDGTHMWEDHAGHGCQV